MSDLVRSTRWFRLAPKGLVVTGDPTYEQWLAYGQVLDAVGESVMWALGDWWNYGYARYGQRASQAKLTGFKYQTCANAGWVASRFELSRRRESLAWFFHNEVAGLPPAEADALLDEAAATVETDDEMTRADLRQRVRERRYLERTAARDWPAGRYGLIYVDPPWQPDAGVLDPTRQIENQYPTMPLEELRALPVGGLAADDCVLLTWVTAQKVVEYVELAEAWGFAHKSGAVWVKDLIGMGYWFRQRHELLMLATRGAPATPLEATRPDSVIQAPRRGHSQKPDEAYAILEAMFPGVPKVELFARRPREGWARWGNE